MSYAHNPYATPKAELHTTSSTEDGPWRDAKLLVVRRFPTGETPALPHRCLKCNQPGTPGKLKPHYWISPLFILLIFVPFGLFILLILYLVLRKKVTVSMVLCDKHLKRSKQAKWIGGLGTLLGLVLIFYGGTVEGVDFSTFGLGWIVLIGSLITSAILHPAIQISRIDNDFARFRGCGKDYLNSLPPVLR